MDKVLTILIMLTLQACAIELENKREYPGVKGVVYSDGKPISGVTVSYMSGYVKKCDSLVASTMTDSRGIFSIPIEEKFKFIEMFPSDGCEFFMQLCIADSEPWEFKVQGNGNKTYHTGGSVRKDPERLLLITS